jgi:hypothetical protein
VDTGIIYTKNVSGITELFYKDDSVSGNETQITKEGAVKIQGFEEIQKVSGTTHASNTTTTVSLPSGS